MRRLPKMGAEAVTRALKGRWYGGYGVAFCPAHRNTRTPALSLADGEEGRLLVHCFAGCGPGAVLASLRSRRFGVDRIVRAGLRSAPGYRAARERAEEARSAAALRIWEQSRPARGSLLRLFRSTLICLVIRQIPPEPA